MTTLNPLPILSASGRTSWPSLIGWTLLAVMCLGIAAYSSRYLLHPPQTQEQALGNPLGVPFLVIHIGGAVTALLLGSLQFIPALRRVPSHRWVGRVYVMACLVGGGAGLILAPGSFAGPIASVGFCSLAVIWIVVTLMGWRAAMQGRFVEHRRWMIRSWALTLAAVTLRLYLPTVQILDLPFLPWYRAISFLAWVPNLIAAEVWLRRGRQRQQQTCPQNLIPSPTITQMSPSSSSADAQCSICDSRHISDLCWQADETFGECAAYLRTVKVRAHGQTHRSYRR